MRLRPGEMAQLIAVLPQQLARRHLALMQLEHAEQHHQSSHHKGHQVLKGNAGTDGGFLDGAVKNYDGDDDDDDHCRHHFLQVLDLTGLSLEFHNLGGEIAMLGVNPGLIHESRSCRIRGALDFGMSIESADAFEHRADPAEAVEPIDAGERQDGFGIDHVIGPRQPAIKQRAHGFRNHPADQMLGEPLL
jgi:hypothetical protein